MMHVPPPTDPIIDVVLVNDTLTGDPLMTVPIYTGHDMMGSGGWPEAGMDIVSLCYEVHGEAEKHFNLVSDSCVSVNSHYSRAVTNPNITLNIVDAIGVRAVANDGTCVNISVGLNGCEVTVNGAALILIAYIEVTASQFVCIPIV